MPKSAVEQLVAAYNRLEATSTVKNHILENPRHAFMYCLPRRHPQPKPQAEQEELAKSKHLHSCIQLLTKLTSELESLWPEIPIPTEIKDALQKALERLQWLCALDHAFAPGQITKGDHYAN